MKEAALPRHPESSCGRAWPEDWDGPQRPRCQRGDGHTGFHVADVTWDDDVHRYWWGQLPGDSGRTVYTSLAQLNPLY
jgi:hypothetical protein